MSNFVRVPTLKTLMPENTELDFIYAINAVEKSASEDTIVTSWVVMKEGRPEKVAMTLQEGSSITFPFFLNVSLPEMENIAKMAYSDVKVINVFTKDQLPGADGWTMFTCNYKPNKALALCGEYSFEPRPEVGLADIHTALGSALVAIAPGCAALILKDEDRNPPLWKLIEEVAAASYAEGREFSVQAMSADWGMALDDHPDFELNNVTLTKTLG